MQDEVSKDIGILKAWTTGYNRNNEMLIISTPTQAKKKITTRKSEFIKFQGQYNDSPNIWLEKNRISRKTSGSSFIQVPWSFVNDNCNEVKSWEEKGQCLLRMLSLTSLQWINYNVYPASIQTVERKLESLSERYRASIKFFTNLMAIWIDATYSYMTWRHCLMSLVRKTIKLFSFF